MFSLKDLIYSQSSQGSSLGEVHNSQLGSQNGVDDVNKDRENDFEDRPELELKKIRLKRNMSQKPKLIKSIDSNSIYSKHPQLNPYIGSVLEEHLQPFAPGLEGYLHFPQASLHDSAELKLILESLFNETYSAKDYEGALMVMKRMAENTMLELPALYAVIDIFRHIEHGTFHLKQLFQAVVISAHPNRRYKSFRCEELCMFAEAFTSMNDLDFILSAFENQVADPSFNESPTLVAMSSLLYCHKAILLAHQLQALCTDTKDPSSRISSVKEISARPLEFSSCVSLLSNISSLNIIPAVPGHSNSIRDVTFQCQKVLVNLKASLPAAANLNPGLDSLGLHLLYLGYLEGIGQSDMAWRYVSALGMKLFPPTTTNENESLLKLGKNIPQPSAVNINASNYSKSLNRVEIFLEMIARYISRFKLSTVREIDGHENLNLASCHPNMKHVIRNFLSITNTLIEVYPANIIPIHVLYSAVSLFKIKLIHSCQMIQILCNAIEISPPKHVFESHNKCNSIFLNCTSNWKSKNKYSPPNIEIYSLFPGSINLYHWYLWRCLASALGGLEEIDIKGTGDDIVPSSDIFPFFENRSKNSFSRLRESKSVAESFSVEESGEDEEGMNTDIFYKLKRDVKSYDTGSNENNTLLLPLSPIKQELSSRNWWSFSILSAFQLGDFVDYVTPAFALKTIDELSSMASCSHMHGYDIPGYEINNSLNTINSIGVNKNRKSNVENISSGTGTAALNDLDGMDNVLIDEDILDHVGCKTCDYDFPNEFDVVVKDLISLFGSGIQHSKSAFRLISNTNSNVESIDEIVFEISKKSLVINPQDLCFIPEDLMWWLVRGMNNFISLSNGLLQILSFQILVNSHINGIDSMFTVRGVQILLQHVLARDSSTLCAMECLKYLRDAGINLARCSILSFELASKDASTCMSIPPNSDDVKYVKACSYFGDPNANMYSPTNL